MSLCLAVLYSAGCKEFFLERDIISDATLFKLTCPRSYP